jgi:hypothetical protein
VGLALALMLGARAEAARLVDVRVGVHPGFARVVLETDAPAAHEVIETGAEVVVRIAAASAARTLPARTVDSPAIVLEPTADGATLAHIRAPGPLRVEAQVLTAPPRVVLDLREGAPSAAAASPQPAEPTAAEPPAEPPTAAALEPAPTSEPTLEPEPTPAPVAAVPKPEPAAVPPAHVAAPEPPADDAGAEPLLPPVSAPSPPGFTLESRSLATGLAIGFALALIAFAARRHGPAERPAAPTAVATAELHNGPVGRATERPAPDVSALGPEAVHDVVRMFQLLDARLAEAATRLDEVAARQDALTARGERQGEEIRAQRAAIARLRNALWPAQGLPCREETATSPRSD